MFIFHWSSPPPPLESSGLRKSLATFFPVPIMKEIPFKWSIYATYYFNSTLDYPQLEIIILSGLSLTNLFALFIFKLNDIIDKIKHSNLVRLTWFFCIFVSKEVFLICFYHRPFVWYSAAWYRSCFWGCCVPSLGITWTTEIFQYSKTMPSSVWERQTALVPKLWHAGGVITQARLPNFSLRPVPAGVGLI